MGILGIGSTLTLLVWLVLLGVKLWALVDLVSRPAPHFEAAGKLTKPAWGLILGLAVVTHLIQVGVVVGLLSIVGTVAAFVYILDVRPALQGLRR